MIFESMLLPSQAVVPLGVALAHLILAFFIIYQRRFINYVFPHLFIGFLFLTVLWNVILVIMVVNGVPTPLPKLTWQQLVPFGLAVLGILYWVFARTFLQLSWKSLWAWLFGLIGLINLALAISLDTGGISLPAAAVAWSNGWLPGEDITFILGVANWGLFMALTVVTALIELSNVQSSAHKNRIQYLLIATILLSIGYGVYLSLLEPFWTTGILITWFGSGVTGYIVVVENLIDLNTAIRRTISTLVIIGVTIIIYIAGIYLVQIFLGHLLVSSFLVSFVDPVLLVAAVSAVLLTIVYTPVKRMSQNLVNHILFGQHYDYQTVIQNYTQAIRNILDLDKLATTALTHIKQPLEINLGLLFMLDFSTKAQLHFRTLPTSATHQYPETLILTRDTPVLHRLIGNGEPLAQYTVDISPHFKNTPQPDRQALKRLNVEWFIPILKQHELIGIFALGPKISGQPYSNQDIRLLTTLADQTALALENASLVDRLQHNLQETTHLKNLMGNVFASMDNGVVTTDLPGRITLFNKAAASIFGLPAENNFAGKRYTKVLPSLAKTFFPNLVNNVIKHDDHYINYELICDLPERGQVDLNVSLAPLKDAHNQTQGVTMVVDDLTETKRLRAVQEMFRRYVSPAVVDRLPADPSKLELGGHRQKVTVLFADIRGFTTFSERLKPEKLVDILNEYLSMAAASILMYEGTLDKFMGDAVMGIFNAPLAQKDHIVRAVRAAIAMQRAIADYHHSMSQKRSLSFGIGIHMGEAVVGNIGMSDRMDYTAIGDTVNLAKRIQENTPGNKILVSQDVHRIIKRSFKCVFFKEMKVKGRKRSVKTYELQLK